jgi:hypothetical protein
VEIRPAQERKARISKGDGNKAAVTKISLHKENVPIF